MQQPRIAFGSQVVSVESAIPVAEAKGYARPEDSIETI